MKFKPGEIGVILPTIAKELAFLVGTEATVQRYLTERDFKIRPSMPKDSMYLLKLCNGRLAVGADKHLRKRFGPFTGEDSITELLRNPNSTQKVQV